MMISVIGLGYVGLPLAVELSRLYSVVGFDTSADRISEIKDCRDSCGEVRSQALSAAFSRGLLWATPDQADIVGAEVYIICVPTPVGDFNEPDLSELRAATRIVATNMRKGAVVIFESSVYPGVTENICVPILSQFSGMAYGVDFHVGYSPERTSPADPDHRLINTVKVVSGSSLKIARFIEKLYLSIIPAGVHLAPSIQVAEASKMVENAQRDVNIAFMNDMAKIMRSLGIRTADVLAAARTKRNFCDFSPGLVGGHCIGVDTHYLASAANKSGHYPALLLTARQINEAMCNFVFGRVVHLLSEKGLGTATARVLLLGVTFKENCPDIRNSMAVKLAMMFKSFGFAVDVCDPVVSQKDAIEKGVGAPLRDLDGVNMEVYSAVVLAVAHDAFKALDLPLSRSRVIYDVKSVLPASDESL